MFVLQHMKKSLKKMGQGMCVSERQAEVRFRGRMTVRQYKEEVACVTERDA